MESDRDSCGVSGHDHEKPTDNLRRSTTPSLPPAAAPNASFLRPTTQRAARRRAPPHSKDRFEAEVLGGKLWYHACQEISKEDFNGQIPMEFPSIDEYIATLDPLVLEEAREGLKNDWTENCAASRTWRVEILSVNERPDGWAHVRVKIQGGREKDALNAFNSNNTAVVLTMGRPPQRDLAQWISSKPSKETTKEAKGGDGGVVAGEKGEPRPVKRSRVDQLKEQETGGAGGGGEKSRQGTPALSNASGGSEAAKEVQPGEKDTAEYSAPVVTAKVVAGLTIRGGGGGGYRGPNRGGGGGDRGLEVTLKIHPCCCPAHASNESTSPCTGVVTALRNFQSAWWMTPAGMLVTSEREFDAVHAVRLVDSDLMRHILKPKLLAEVGKYYAQDDVRRKMWPVQAGHPAFLKYLKSQYDYKQLEAIEMAACLLGGGGSTHTTSTAAAPQPSRGASSSKPPPSSSTKERGAQQPASTSRLRQSATTEKQKQQQKQQPPPNLSFVLIQGPPGTGKTHTVRGVLNVWHLVAFQKYYESMVQHVLPQGGSAAGAGGAPFEILRTIGEKEKNKVNNSSTNKLGATFAATKPRILICTPSNAACDELMFRVMSLCFCDGGGNIYRPNIVRVGADDSVLAPKVRERSLKSLVARYTGMSQPEWQRRSADTVGKIALAEQEVVALEAALERCKPGKEANDTARRLVDRVQATHRLHRELERLEAARDLVWGTGSGGDGGGDEAAIRAAAYKAEIELEALLLGEAEMVFATLSSTQRKVFKAVATRSPFRTVLIDEAGQSSEVAALQPLAFGAKQVVLVGDPQQLPATILSEAAKSVAMERSLFERLQAQGCPVVLLTVQYRMHPEIRSFPSRHFYEDKLEDAASVTKLPPEIYHSQPLFKPYAIFDVAKGKEQRRQGAGGSLSNVAEAELAACMYASLRSFLLEHHKKAAEESKLQGNVSNMLPSKVSVAVITPYREQRAVLRQTFTSVCNSPGSPDVLKEVAIETIDSYQGRQVDIVILSCVRAGAAGGLGFVNDIRRLNVAITRARRSLWVLGSVATLRSNVEWRALIDDAEERGLVIHDAHAEKLFPDVEYWQRKESGGGNNKEERTDKQQQQQKQQTVNGTGGVGVGPSSMWQNVGADKKGLPREEKEEAMEEEKEEGDGVNAAAQGRKQELHRSWGAAPAKPPAVRPAGGGGGRGTSVSNRGAGRGGGRGSAAAGRGNRGGSTKRERSLSPQPETETAVPGSASKYPSMPTRR